MSSTAHDAFVHSVEENLMCSICRSLLNEPKTLLCLHSFCTSCLEENWVRATDRTICPCCRTKHNATEFEDFPDDFTKKELIRSLKQHTESVHDQVDAPVQVSNTSKQCFTCTLQSSTELSTSQNPVVAICMDCDILLCKTCMEKHNAIAEDHEVRRRVMINRSHLELCSQHPEQTLDYYCRDCKHTVCIICRMIVAHKGHSVEKTQYMTRRIRGDIDILKSALKKKFLLARNFENARKNILDNKQQELESIRSVVKNCRQDIDNYETRIIENIDKSTTNLLDKVDEAFIVSREGRRRSDQLPNKITINEAISELGDYENVDDITLLDKLTEVQDLLISCRKLEAASRQFKYGTEVEIQMVSLEISASVDINSDSISNAIGTVSILRRQ